MTHNGRSHSAEDAEAIRRHELSMEIDDAVMGEAYREASKRLLPILDQFLIFVVEAANPVLAAWQAAYALGLPCSTEMTQDEKAAQLGVVRATMSKGAQKFRRAAGLPPSLAAKPAEATAAYAEARTRNLLTA